LATRDWFSVDF